MIDSTIIKHYWCLSGQHTKEMEEEGKNALEVDKEEAQKNKEGAEEESWRALRAKPKPHRFRRVDSCTR
ncbi:MAG: hypothetical protein KGH72_02585 [Candidatus Micrarchaeota archaeon]|nr:hypothetical protein [Candidatus Micrarchaeota archaeon]